MNPPKYTSYTRYYCHACGTECIEKITLSHTRYRECRKCHSVPVLDRGEPIDKLLPSIRWAVSAILHDFEIYPKAAGDLAVRETRGSVERHQARMGDQREPNERRGGAVDRQDTVDALQTQ